MGVDVASVPYSTIILHCLKYPHSGVYGILLGTKNGNKIKIYKGFTGCVYLSKAPFIPSSPRDAMSCIEAKLIDHVAQRRRYPAGVNIVNPRPVAPLSALVALVAEISSAVPLSHESSPLAPTIEVALAVVHASYPNIVGVYYSNQNYKDKSLNPYAVRLAESVTSVCGTSAVLVQVINWNLSPDCESNSLAAYVKDGESWKDVRLDTSSESLTTLSRAIHNKLYRSLNDFENHLDRPECDFYNTSLSQKLGQLIG